MINFKTIIRIIGILLLLETVMFLVCSGVSFYSVSYTHLTLPTKA